MEKSVEILPYSKKYLELWESLVENSNNGTLYHTQKFLDYHGEGRFENFHHLLALDGKITALIPGCVTKSEAGKTFVSYAGASFGGFVVPEEFGLSDADVLVCAFLRYLREKKFKRVDITLPPLFFNRRQNHHMDFILSREGFGFKKREITSVITLNYPNDDDKQRFTIGKNNGTLQSSTKIGNLIEIHGEGGKGIDWTQGCVALHNKDMDVLFKLVDEDTPVTIVGSLKSLKEIMQEYGQQKD